MKKNPIIFIAMLIALAFTSCQMNTDDAGPNSDVQLTPDPTYGFVSSVDYEIYAPDGTTKIMSKKGSELNEAAKELGLVKDTDYTIDGTKVTLTVSGMEKIPESGFPASDSGEPTTTEPTDTTNGGEDDGTGTGGNSTTTTEYTVSVADGIKGGYIEVSTDKEKWEKFFKNEWINRTFIKYAKGTKLYVRAVAANSFYKLDKVGFTSSNGESGWFANNSSVDDNWITVDDDITLNATFVFLGQRSIETLKGEITSGTSYKDNLKCGIFIYCKYKKNFYRHL